MSKKATLGLIVLALITIISVSVFQVVRESVPRSVVTVEYKDNKNIVDPFRLEKVDVKGTLKTAEGESKEINSKGFRLEDVIKAAQVPEEGYSKVKVLSDDAYSAELTADEARDNQKTFFVIDEDKETHAQTLRLIVFGDNDSKRQVKNAVKLEITK